MTTSRLPVEAASAALRKDAVVPVLARGNAAESRFLSLDGLRAISIGMVIFSHCVGTRGFLLHSHEVLSDLGSLGVRIFFVISGFLITSLLLQEFRVTHRIDLGLFYARRSVRIFPACYLYIVTVWLLDTAGVIQIKPYDVVHAATYTMNYHPNHGWHLGHLWSLAVEEQFYLLWPLVLALVGMRRGMWVALATIALCPLIRLGMIYTLGTDVGTNRIFPAVADSLATGCLLAGVRNWCEGDQRYMAILRSRFFYLVPFAIVAINASVGGRPKIMCAVGATTLNVSIALCLHRWVVCPGDRVGRVLNSRSFVTVGVLSYSLYLWQQLFINRSSDAWFNSFPWNVVFTFVAAWASYRLFEKPLLELRKRLRPKCHKPNVALPQIAEGLPHASKGEPSPHDVASAEPIGFTPDRLTG